jgi:alpha-1,6-mannosyltransferase
MSPAAKLTILACLSELAYGSLYFFPSSTSTLFIKFIATSIFCSVLYLFALFLIKQKDSTSDSRRTLIIIFLAGTIFRLTLLFLPPFISDDIYRYIWDGRVQAAGINPYSYAPTAVEVAHLRENQIYPFINHPTLPTIYPPLSQFFFYLAYLIGRGSLLGFKLIAFIVEIISFLLLVRLLGRVGCNRAMALVYFWSPLPIVEFSISGHLDALGIPLLILFIDRMIAERPRQAAIALAGAALVKFLPIIFLPFIARRLGWRRAIEFCLLFGLTFIAGYLPFLGIGFQVFGSLGTYIEHWSFNGSFFPIINSAVGSYQVARKVSFIAVVVWTTAVVFVARDLKRGLFWTLAGVYLFSPVVYPWYLTWIVPLLAFERSRAFLLLLTLMPLSYLSDSSIIRAFEYLPFFAMLGYDLICSRKKAEKIEIGSSVISEGKIDR